MKTKKKRKLTFPKFDNKLQAAVWAMNYANLKHTCKKCKRLTASLDTGPCCYCFPPTNESSPVKKKKEGKSFIKIARRYHSTSEPGTVYEVRVFRATGEFFSCSCPSFFYRKTCKHKTRYEESK